MKKGLVPNRGILNKRPPGPNKEYLDDLRAKKFSVTPSDLSQEDTLDKMVLRNNVKKDKIRKFIISRMKSDPELYADLVKEFNKQGRAVNSPAFKAELQRRVEERKSWHLLSVQLQLEDQDAAIDLQFQQDFVRWLQGKGKEEDHVKTPWYKQPLMNPSVDSYLMVFHKQKFEFLKEIDKLRAKGFLGLDDVYEYYLYFKYIIRGGWQNVNESDYLRDWTLIMKESAPLPSEPPKFTGDGLTEYMNEQQEAVLEPAQPVKTVEFNAEKEAEINPATPDPVELRTLDEIYNSYMEKGYKQTFEQLQAQPPNLPEPVVKEIEKIVEKVPDDVKNQLTQQATQIAHMTNTIAALNAAQATEKLTKEQALAQVNVLESQVGKLKTQLSDEQQQRIQQLAAQQAALQNPLTSTQQALQNSLTQLAAVQQELQTNQSQQRRLADELETAQNKAKLAEEATRMRDRQIEEHKLKQKEYESSLSEAQKTIKAKQKRINRISKDKEAAELKYQEDKQKLIDAMKSDTNAALSEQLDLYRQELDNKQQLSTEEKQRAVAEKQAELTAAFNNQVNTERQTHQANMERLKSEMDSYVAGLNLEKDRLQQELNNAARNSEQMTQEYNALLAKANQYMEKVDVMNQTKDSMIVSEKNMVEVIMGTLRDLNFTTPRLFDEYTHFGDSNREAILKAVGALVQQTALAAVKEREELKNTINGLRGEMVKMTESYRTSMIQVSNRRPLAEAAQPMQVEPRENFNNNLEALRELRHNGRRMFKPEQMSVVVNSPYIDQVENSSDPIMQEVIREARSVHHVLQEPKPAREKRVKTVEEITGYRDIYKRLYEQNGRPFSAEEEHIDNAVQLANLDLDSWDEVKDDAEIGLTYLGRYKTLLEEYKVSQANVHHGVGTNGAGINQNITSFDQNLAHFDKLFVDEVTSIQTITSEMLTKVMNQPENWEMWLDISNSGNKDIDAYNQQINKWLTERIGANPVGGKAALANLMLELQTQTWYNDAVESYKKVVGGKVKASNMVQFKVTSDILGVAKSNLQIITGLVEKEWLKFESAKYYGNPNAEQTGEGLKKYLNEIRLSLPTSYGGVSADWVSKHLTHPSKHLSSMIRK